MTKNLSIQIFSDIHIELWDKLPIIPIKAKYLFLAGDICQLNHLLFYPFLSFCSKNWEKVFYIPGNHEFYSNRKNYNELNFEYDLKIKEDRKPYLVEGVESLIEVRAEEAISNEAGKVGALGRRLAHLCRESHGGLKII